MATVSYYKTKSGRRWQVQYTKPDGSRTRKRGFSTKAEAQAWIEDQGVAQRKGTWVDPALSNIPLSELWGPWIAIKKMRHGTSTWKPLDSAWRTHVKPHWGLTPINQITTEQLQTRIVDLSENKSVTIVERCLGWRLTPAAAWTPPIQVEQAARPGNEGVVRENGRVVRPRGRRVVAICAGQSENGRVVDFSGPRACGGEARGRGAPQGREQSICEVYL